MQDKKRVILMVLDSVGIGEMPDAAEYGDAGSNTLKAASTSRYFSMPNMRKLGYFNIDGVDIGEKEANPQGSFARMTEVSKGKDTTIGHWEISGIISEAPLPTYPNGFPQEVLHSMVFYSYSQLYLEIFLHYYFLCIFLLVILFQVLRILLLLHPCY